MPDYSCRNWTVFQSFLGKLYENPVAIKATPIKKLPTSPLGKPCLLSLNWIYRDNKDYLARKTNLAILLVSTILDFWTHSFQATVLSTEVHWLRKFTIWWKTCFRRKILWIFVELCNAVLKLCPNKSFAMFWTTRYFHIAVMP